MKPDRKDPSALHIAPGVEQPSAINPALARQAAERRKKVLQVEDYVDGIRRQDRGILSRAITLVESHKPEHRKIAEEVIRQCYRTAETSLRIGVTGIPGVGKSTFLEALGNYLCDTFQRRIAVLAVDPTSQRSRGSILGDKTRMAALVNRPDVFIRPSPTSGALGGVTQASRETILLCEAAGYDVIFVETVGVGQSETMVHGMVDFFLLLMLPGAGDELQGIKRGIMEMADGILITKADGDNRDRARIARQEARNALRLFPASMHGWTPPVLMSSAVTGDGVPEVWQMICDFERSLKEQDHWTAKRQRQRRQWMRDTIQFHLQQSFYEDPEIRTLLPDVEAAVIAGHESPFEAARRLLSQYRHQRINGKKGKTEDV